MVIHRYKKKSAVLLALAILLLPGFVFAFPGQPGLLNITLAIQGVSIAAATIFWAATGIAFSIAALLFLTANGDPGKIKLARDAVIWGGVGTIVGLIAFSIPSIIASFFPGV